MATVQATATPVDTGSSPRSTVLIASPSMTTEVSSMNEKNMASGLPTADEKVASSGPPAKDVSESDSINPAASTASDGKSTTDDQKGASSQGDVENELNTSSSSQPQVAQGGGAYYPGYPGGAPESPNVAPNIISGIPYESSGSTFMQPGTTFAAAHTSPFGVPSGTNTPLSPPRSTASMVSIPPASPLFPRANSGGLDGHTGLAIHQMTPQSPGISYSMSLGSPGPYASYPSSARMTSQNSSSSDDGNWDRNSHNPGNYASPQLMYGVMGRSALGGRTYSMDSDSMLPPAMLDPQDQPNPAYSPYSTGHPSSPASMFTHQQAWSYPGPLPDMYSTPGSPLQPRPTASAHMYPGGPMAGGMRPIPNPYGHPHHYYPASSPGPPIQTTASNKGPDGANLFIFHIPNHFTNVDMYNLFCAYGNLLSVRIMVEKDTGRSRGFGFVSYDNPESAALAIKELNGYAIGNKRLKVQHKQIRQRDLIDRDGTPGGGRYGDHSSGGTFSSSLPPSGPGGESIWRDPRELTDGGESTTTTAVANAVANTAGVKQAAEDAVEEGNPRVPVEAVQSTDASSPLGNLGALQSALPEVANSPEQE